MGSVEIPEKLRDYIKQVAEDRYYPMGREPNDSEKRSAANFICGAQMFAEIVVFLGSEIITKDLEERITKLENRITNNIQTVDNLSAKVSTLESPIAGSCIDLGKDIDL